MDHNLEILLGCLMLFYGFAKLIIGTIACFFPPELRKKATSIKILGFFISDDLTLAGKVFDIALMIFGIYTIIHGLDMIHVLPENISEFVMKRHIMYYLNGIMGTCLIIFYSLVIFTNVKIPKMEDHKDRYMIEGLCSGIMFVLMLPLLAIFHDIHDNGFNKIYCCRIMGHCYGWTFSTTPSLIRNSKWRSWAGYHIWIIVITLHHFIRVNTPF